VKPFLDRGGDPSNAQYFEFGAGWDLFANFVLYCYGFDHQLLVDLTPRARPFLINDVIRELRDKGRVELPGACRRPEWEGRR